MMHYILKKNNKKHQYIVVYQLYVNQNLFFKRKKHTAFQGAL